VTENIISEGVIESDLVAGKGIDKTGDKVLSTKFKEKMQKILESFKETLSSEDNENLKADELFQEFNEILQRPKETAH
jgi:hypothetical protein